MAYEGSKIVEVGEESAYVRSTPTPLHRCQGWRHHARPYHAHTHIYSALARGLSIDGYNPTSFYEVLDGQWWYIDRNLDLELPSQRPGLVIDSIKQGVTTIFDHHASFCEVPAP